MIDLDLLFDIYKIEFIANERKDNPVELGLLAVYDKGYEDGFTAAFERMMKEKHDENDESSEG